MVETGPDLLTWVLADSALAYWAKQAGPSWRPGRLHSWRDAKRALWALNTVAPAQLPSAELSSVVWLIATVTFPRHESGTTAEVLLMPKSAFVPEPLNFLPFDAAIVRVCRVAGLRTLRHWLVDSRDKTSSEVSLLSAVALRHR